VTHDQTEALAAADHILLLKDGQIIQEGSPYDIYSNPKSFYAADFLGNNNVARGKLQALEGENAIIGGDGWSLKGVARDLQNLQPSQDVSAVIRVENIAVCDAAGPNRMQMQLDDSLYLGDRWEYHIRCGGLTAKAHGAKSLPAGPVWCEFRPQDVWVFSSVASVA
jgi:iron(III) transport system ATP-binding protein